MATAPHPSSTALLTAEEFARRPDPGYPEELVKGRIVAMTPPGFRHGKVCARVARVVGNHVEEYDLGHVVSNDAGVVTERAPDSVRGPDVAFYRYERLPRDARIEGYPPVAPDLVIEVLSPHDRWNRVLAKVAEYLEAGVAVVGVLDPERRRLDLYQADAPVQVLMESDTLALPAILGDFRLAVGRLLD